MVEVKRTLYTSSTIEPVENVYEAKRTAWPKTCELLATLLVGHSQLPFIIFTEESPTLNLTLFLERIDAKLGVFPCMSSLLNCIGLQAGISRCSIGIPEFYPLPDDGYEQKHLPYWNSQNRKEENLN